MTNLADRSALERVNHAIDHITRNLDAPLRLDDIASVACVSPYHFHRVFKAVTGEAVNAFVRRLRLERARYLMAHASPPSLADVALACGFSSASDFSRVFRRQFGIPPSLFDAASWRDSGRNRLEQAVAPVSLVRLSEGENPDGFCAQLVDIPARHVAYIRVFQPFETGNVPAAADRLVAWAAENNLEHGQWLGYMWEDPEIVPLDKCRYDVGVEVPAGTAVSGEVGIQAFPAMRVAQVDVDGPIEAEQRALDWLYGTWLPASTWSPDHQPCFEAWNGLPFAHGMTRFDLSVQLPIV